MRNSGVPLHYQIAAALRYRIASGELLPSTMLPSLRAGARKWGVNLHTVRHAYRQLEKEGLVKTSGRRGTWIALSSDAGQAALEGVDSFLRDFLLAARERYGLKVDEVIERFGAIRDQASDKRRRVWVIECSTSLATGLALQIRRSWRVDARPWSLDRASDVPEGVVVGTYFHHNEIRLALFGREDDLHFVSVRVAKENLLAPLEEKTSDKIVLCGIEKTITRIIEADIRAQLGEGLSLELVVTDEPKTVLQQAGGEARIVFTPSCWDRLSPEERAHPSAIQLRTPIDPGDLRALGRRYGWRAI